MEDKIIIDRMDAEEFLEMLMDAANQDNPNQYYSNSEDDDVHDVSFQPSLPPGRATI